MILLGCTYSLYAVVALNHSEGVITWHSTVVYPRGAAKCGPY